MDYGRLKDPADEALGRAPNNLRHLYIRRSAMPGPSKRKRQPTQHPLAPTPDPQEGINPRLEEPSSEPDENRADDEHVGNRRRAPGARVGEGF